MMLRSPAYRIAGILLAVVTCANPCGAAESDQGGNGRLDLEKLIRLALENNPKLAELRGDVSTAIARERSAGDWEDPEIRVALSKDRDVELPQQETETRTTTNKRSGSSRESSQDQRREKENGVDKDPENRSTSSEEDFDSVTTTRTTRTVQHGARSETITEETWESSTGSASSRESSNISKGADRIERTEDATSTQRERLVDRTVEQRMFDSDITTPDEDVNVKLRLRVPNPFERKANIARARARVGLATAVLNSAEHELALAVRKSYADAVAANEKYQGAKNLALVHERMAEEISEMGTWAKLEDEIAAQSDRYRSSLELPILQLELERELAQLASVVGLSDPTRIALDSQIAPTRLDLGGLDNSFLYEVAEGYRGDILSLVHELKMSEFEKAAYDARRIPWFTFVEGFYGVEYDRGHRSSDNYGIQFGMTIPLFTWFKNKRHEVLEQEQQSLNIQAAAVRRTIVAEIDSAVSQMRRASALMNRFESDRKRYAAAMKESLAKAEQGGVQSNDARFRAQEALAKLDELEPDLLKGYNEAILMLEHAVGTSLDEVFSDGTDQPPSEVGKPMSLRTQSTSSEARASVPNTQAIQKRRRPPHRR